MPAENAATGQVGRDTAEVRPAPRWAAPRGPGPLALGLGLVALSLASAVLDDARDASDAALAGELRVGGTVMATSEGAETQAVDLRIERAAPAWSRARVLLPARRGAVIRLRGLAPGRLARGDVVVASVRARVIPRYRNPGAAPPWPAPSDAPASTAVLAHRRALRVVGARRDVTSLLAALVEPTRRAMRRGLRRTLPQRAAAMARAMALGEPQALSAGERADLARAGLAHLVAVSGLNVVLVVGVLAWALRALLRRVPPLAARTDATRIVGMVTLPLAAAFTALTGFQPSAVRASTMTAIAGALVALGRRPRAAPVLGATLLASCLVDPEAPRRPGFLLSLVATAALVHVASSRPGTTDGSRREGRIDLVSRAARQLATLVRTNVRATLATAPAVLWLFGQLPWVGLAANLLAVPATSLVLLPLCLAQGLVAALAPAPARWLAPLTDAACRAFVAFASFVARAPPLTPPPPTAGQLAASTIAAGALLWPASWRRRATVAAVAALVVGALELHLRAPAGEGKLVLTFLDVGQGDAALAELPDGRRILIDAGDRLAGDRSVAPWLRSRRIDHLDAVVVTHPHPDHYGGVVAVAQVARIGELWDVGLAPRDAGASAGEWGRTLDALAHAGVRVRGPTELCRAPPLAGVRVLAPCPAVDPLDDPNDASFVLRLSHGTRSFLLAGDVERRAEARLLERAASGLRADVLKVPHHGSATSSGADWLARVRPSLAIVSLGAGNRFGHPHPEIVRRYPRAGIRLLRTDRCGGVRVWTDGRAIGWETAAGCDEAAR